MAARTADKLSDQDFLAICHEEMRQSVGFDNDDDLASNREKALEYFKGEVDVASLPNRSAANSTDLADAVETVMPDLMEIFTGGDDVATFRPMGAEDEAAAEQETDYVTHAIFSQNRGWLAFFSFIQDALLQKIGVAKVWGEEDEEVCEEAFTNQSAESITLIEEQNSGEIVDLIATEPDPLNGQALFNFTLRTKKPLGYARISAVNPADFTVARDTIVIADTTYCAMRSRPRAQDLIADGYDPEDVADLSPYGSDQNDSLELARDQAGEHSEAVNLSTSLYNLHQVEIVEHYVRVDADGDGKPELWCVVTDADCAHLLKRERADRIPFAVVTPFLMAHRLIGMSLYDKLREVQRIKTALLRMMLDSGYFALNQRYEVAMDRANSNTLSDLLNNVPGSPIQSKTGDAVRALGGGGLAFNVFEAMEHVAVMGEQRTGIVRNAQGLNPDTLHETKAGMLALMGAAAKRTRMIARVMAETGIKDVYLLMHDVLRTTAKGGDNVPLRGQWVTINPSKWQTRKDMVIEVGVGSGGREMEMAALQLVMGAQEKLVTLQGGAEGPWVSAKNLYNTAKRLTDRAGLRNTDLYFSDPETYKAPEQAAPPPDPELVKIQTDAEVEKYKADLEDKRKRDQMAGEFELERERMRMEAQARVLTGAVTSLGRPVEMGGDVG